MSVLIDDNIACFTKFQMIFSIMWIQMKIDHETDLDNWIFEVKIKGRGGGVGEKHPSVKISRAIF